MKQTAVEWLFNELWDSTKDKLEWHSKLKQALEMEKHQPQSWVKDCTCPDDTGVVFCCDECGLPLANKLITDEEICKSAEELKYTDGTYGFKEGIKWYRKQIKLK
jgi:hypothetical protein